MPERSDGPGRAFLRWLREAINTGQIPVTGPNAHVYRVAEGVLLASPGIFQDYDEQGWQEAQKRFLKLKLHRKTSQGSNFVTYRFADNPTRVVTGLIISKPQCVFGDQAVPAVNSNLTIEAPGLK